MVFLSFRDNLGLWVGVTRLCASRSRLWMGVAELWVGMATLRLVQWSWDLDGLVYMRGSDRGRGAWQLGGVFHIWIGCGTRLEGRLR